MHGGDCLVFSSDPLIIYVPDWVIRYQPIALLPVLRQFRKRYIYLLILLSWTRDNPRLIKQLKLWHAGHLRRHPRHRVIFMANSEVEYQMLTAAGLETAWVNHNAFVSPAIFRNLQESDKHFDAVYDARVDPFKRHKLAAAIESLALITARSHHDESYTRLIKRILTQAYWFNDPLASDYHFMSLPEINSAINQCRVGLCLSAEEGAMYASMQYLLAGLPVVSTKNRGGRDEFFDPDYVRIVADSADAVAAGVREMRDCPVPAMEIRHRTLGKIELHKNRLFDLLDTICAIEGCRANLRCRWDSWAAGQLSGCITPAAIRKRIENAVNCTTDYPV
jgi:glycosyltransferase involved in cell wall biosynthesis